MKKTNAFPQQESEATLSLPSGTPDGFQPTALCGLSAEEAETLQRQGLGNCVSENPGRTVLRIIADNLFTLFNLLNVLLACALLTVHAYRNMLFLGVVVSNTLIGTVQELRARKTVNRLKLLSEAPIRVRRDGAVLELRAEEAVKGDLVLLRTGDQVPADAILREGTCDAGEALLTGEQDAVPKKTGDWLYSGSYLTAGEAVCQLVCVGDESYVNRLTRKAKKIVPPHSALMTDLKRIVRFVSILLVPIGILLFCKQYFLQHAELERAIPSTVAAMVGMIPEGLMLLASVALAVGVVRLGRKRTLVQELFGIETLARVDTLCLDKTGTLTTGSMKLTKLSPSDSDEEEFRTAISRVLGPLDRSSATLSAIAREIEPGQEPAVTILPFSSTRKLSAATFGDGKTLVIGAPSFVLGQRFCGKLKQEAEGYADQGLRVLCLAECEGMIEGPSLPPIGRILGLILLTDELRPNVRQALSFFKEQGVDLRVISGDDPITVSRIAETAGLEHASEHAVDVSLLSEEELLLSARDSMVFGRVTPERKHDLILALKAQGHTVAMTGDGVNDIPAMKCADCSIAMAGGSDAARHAAQLILLDSDFCALPEIVSEGRRVINNISRTASLFLVKTLYSFVLSLLILFLPSGYPFQPIQLTLVSALTVGLPSFFLALEPNAERIRGKFLLTVFSRALPGALAVTLCATVASLLEGVWTAEECSTLATLATGAIGLLMLLTVSLPFSRIRAAVFFGMCVLFTSASLLFGSVFLLVPLRGEHLLILLGLIAAGAAVLFAVRALIRRLIRSVQEAGSPGTVS